MMHDGSMTHTQHPQSAPPGRSLRRSSGNRIVAGVAGGLGEHLGINAWWLRLAFIVLAFVGGAGVLLYIVAWIFVPASDEEEPAVTNWLANLDLTDSGTVIGVVLIGAAALILATSVFDISGTLVTAAILFAVGLILYRGGLKPPTTPGSQPDVGTSHGDEPAASSTTPSTSEVDGVRVGAAMSAGAVALPPPPPPPPPPPLAKQPKKPRERSMLGRLTLAVGIIVVSGMALIEVAGVSIGSVGAGEWFDPIHYVIAALLVVGAGLIVGAWVGRARWLITIGFLLLPVLVVASLWPRQFPLTAGDEIYTPISVEEIEYPYELGAGQLTIDLTGLTATELEQIGTITATLGVGQLQIYIPNDVGVRVDARVGVGEIQMPGPNDDGIGVDILREIGPAPTTLVLDVEVGAGEIVIIPRERTTP
jgi:phage shock protein PspC (stress-responsive transcriptional regulator)